MADIITRLKFETDEFHNRARRMTTEINDISHKMEVAGNAVDHTNAKNLKLAQSFGTVQTASTTLRGKVSELQDAFIAWGHHYNMLTEKQKQDPYGRAIVQQLDILKGRIRETKAEMEKLEGEMKGGKGGGMFAGFGKQMMSALPMGMGMGAGMFAANVAIKGLGLMKDAVKYNIQTNMEFEQSNANLAAVLGKTKDEMAKLTENAKQLGATTLYTANEITELQTVLARRGFREDQILQMTHGISNLALATGTGLADAAELAGSTMQAFGMKADQMERIVSVLGVSTTKSALTTEKLGTALQYVAPTAAAAGFSLEDTVAILGKLVDAGIDASTAGTSLRQIILAMSTANGKLAKSLGHPVRGMHDFLAAIKDVSKAEDVLSSMSQEVRVTAVPAMLALVNNAEGLEKLRGSLDGVNDELQEMADKQADTLRGEITLLKSAWDGWMLSLNDSKGTLRSTISLFRELIDAEREYQTLKNGGWGAGDLLFGNDHEWSRTPKQEADELLSKFMVQYKDRIDPSTGKKYTGDNLKLAAAQAAKAEFERVYGNNSGVNERYMQQVVNYKNFDNAIKSQFLPASPSQVKRARELMSRVMEVYSNLTGAKMSDVRKMNWETVVREVERMLSERKFNNELNKAASDYLGNYIDLLNGKPQNSTATTSSSHTNGHTTAEPVDRVLEMVERAKQNYAEKEYELSEKLKHGNITQNGYDKGMLGLTQMMYETFGKAVFLDGPDNPRFKKDYEAWTKKVSDMNSVVSVSDALDRVAKAERKYEEQIELETLKEDESLQGRINMAKKMTSGMEQLYSVYAEQYVRMKEETDEEKKVKASMHDKMKESAIKLAEYNSTLEGLNEEMQRQRQQRAVYNRALNGIEGMARQNNIRYEDLGVGGFKQMINDNLMDDKTMQGAVDKLNEQLKTKGIRWSVQLDLETGTLEKLKSRLDELFEGFGNGVGGVKSIVGALDSIKNAGESLKETLEGDADAWDKMMSVMDFGFSILESVVTAYEAVNAIMDVAQMFKKKDQLSTIAQAGAQAAEVEATAGGVIATTAKAAAEEASAEMSLAAAKGSLAHANAIVIEKNAMLGLAGAAKASMEMTALMGAYAGGNAAGLAATQIMRFADGGVVPGAYNGGRDTVPALLSPQEIVLNRAQTNNLAAQLVPARQQQSMAPSQPYVTGEMLWLGLSNFLMRTGRGEIVTTRR